MSQRWIKYIPVFIRTRLEGRLTLQKVLGNIGWLVADKIIRMGVGLFIGVWIARYLGPEQFGIFNYAQAFVAVFAPFATLGLEGIVVREIVKSSTSKEELLGTAFVLKLICGVLIFFIVLIAITIVRPEDRLVQCLIGIIAGGVIFQALDTIDMWFESQVASKYIVFIKNISFLIISCLKLAMIVIGAPLLAFAWAALAEITVSAIGMMFMYKLRGCHISQWLVNFNLGKKLLRESWPLMFSSTFVLINMNIDKIMLGEMSGDKEVGLYAAAAKLSEIWYFIPVMLGASVAPVLTVMNDRDRSSYNTKVQNIYSLMTLTAIIISCPVSFISGKVVEFVYGQGYSHASHMLSVHIWSTLFIFHVSIRARTLIIEGKQRFIALYAFFTALFNILLNWILIPLYGGVGASYASLFSWMLCVLLVPYFSSETAASVRMFFKSFNLVYLFKRISNA